MAEVQRSGHVVLDAVEAEAYSSLRRRPTPRAERYALGRRLRAQARGLLPSEPGA